MKTQSPRKPKAGSLIKRFLPYYKKYKFTMACDLFCATLTTLCELALPLIVKMITERATNDNATLDIFTAYQNYKTAQKVLTQTESLLKSARC